jgi:hypothetical protein
MIIQDFMFDFDTTVVVGCSSAAEIVTRLQFLVIMCGLVYMIHSI